MFVGGGIDPCGSCDRTPVRGMVHILATLCSFDDKYRLGSKPGPFIPWERRLAYIGISGIQGRDFWTGF